MKILGISAGRRGGNSESMLKYALKGAEEKGCEVSLLRLQDFQIEPCTGCESCVNRKLSGLSSKCSIPSTADDYDTYVDAIMEADGFIIAAPCYNLTVPGRLLDALNRQHCFLSQLKEKCTEKPKYAATIGVGGTDWINYLMPMLNFTATECCGSQMHLVDQMLVDYTPARAAVVIDQAALDRAYLLGQNLASVTLSGKMAYLGDAEEICPICHGSHLQLYKGQFICPACKITCHVTEKDGKIKVLWEQGYEDCRWSPKGYKEHLDGIRAGQGKAHENAEKIKENTAKIKNYLEPVMPAEKGEK